MKSRHFEYMSKAFMAAKLKSKREIIGSYIRTNAECGDNIVSLYVIAQFAFNPCLSFENEIYRKVVWKRASGGDWLPCSSCGHGLCPLGPHLNGLKLLLQVLEAASV